MAGPATRPSNANKHPGQVVLDANRVRRSRDEVAAEKSRKQGEKTSKTVAMKKAHVQIAAKEDAMAVEQRAQLAGPGPLVRPKPRPVPKKPVSATLKSTVTASSATMPVPSHANLELSQDEIPAKKKHPKLTFKEGVIANRKVPNSSVSTKTRVGTVDDGKIGKPLNSAASASSKSEGIVKDWAKKVASKAKPSALLSAHVANNDLDVEAFNIDDATEEFNPDHREAGGEGVVHMIETDNHDDALRGRKRTFSTVSLDSDLTSLAPEELHGQEDPDGDVATDENASDVDDDVNTTQMAVDQHCNTVEASGGATARLTTSMSVDVSDSDDDRTTKYIKTESGCAPVSHRAASLNLKKGRAKNSQLPSDIHGTWRSRCIPALMHWVGNTSFPWTIPDNELSNALYEIYKALKSRTRVVDFEVDSAGFIIACQRIHEWRASFGSTAITVLMAFFALMGDEYKTQEARKEYAEYQLEDSRFVYEDPDSEERPGAFLST